MAFDPEDEYDEDNISFMVEREFNGSELEAYCTPDAEGRTFIGGGSQRLPFETTDRAGAPFAVDIVIEGNERPSEEELYTLRQELGDSFNEKFNARVDEVYEILDGEDDPLDAILSLDPDELVVDEATSE